mmetsp:Transcript_133993/g.250709  ORF Transcript_133993/g.250709 Transcript_133993/m.250709 type:complete len:138 (-) Transcript_133993:2445-2858(-)
MAPTAGTRDTDSCADCKDGVPAAIGFSLNFAEGGVDPPDRKIGTCGPWPPGSRGACLVATPGSCREGPKDGSGSIDGVCNWKGGGGVTPSIPYPPGASVVSPQIAACSLGGVERPAEEAVARGTGWKTPCCAKPPLL